MIFFFILFICIYLAISYWRLSIFFMVLRFIRGLKQGVCSCTWFTMGLRSGLCCGMFTKYWGVVCVVVGLPWDWGLVCVVACLPWE